MSQFLITVYYELTQSLTPLSEGQTDTETRPATNTERSVRPRNVLRYLEQTVILYLHLVPGPRVM